MEIHHVDAFSAVPFKGNPAAVVLLDEKKNSTWMKKFAAEFNLPATAFVHDQDGELNIFYFTPMKQIDLCGHASLAAAHVLFNGRYREVDRLRFKTISTIIEVSKQGNQIGVHFPKPKIEIVDVWSNMSRLIGFNPIKVYNTSLKWVIAIAERESDILRANPSGSVLTNSGLGHLVISARSENFNTDIVTRCFIPSAGVYEDPVTGSAHSALAVVWHMLLGRKIHSSSQLSSRSGRIVMNECEDRVEIFGQAITLYIGRIF